MTVDVGPQRQVLALLEAELVGERVGHRERDRDGVACLALDARDGQRVKFAHCTTPALASFAAALPPEGAQFASWDGPAMLISAA